MAKNSTDQFCIKNGLVWCNWYSENSDKSKYKYNGYGVAFDGKGNKNFGNDSARNVVIFGIDNSS